MIDAPLKVKDISSDGDDWIPPFGSLLESLA